MSRLSEEIKAYSLTLLGTDTSHLTHLDDGYPRGETLTALFHGIEGERGFDISRGDHKATGILGRIANSPLSKAPYREVTGFIHHGTTGTTPEARAEKLKTVTKDIIDGPDSCGYLPPEKIAEATARILYQIAMGDKDVINISAHSRGAVEAILVAHELERIKSELIKNPNPTTEELKTIICGSPKKETKEALEKILPKLEDIFGTLHSKVSDLSNKIQSTKLNIFAVDPVPGGDYQSIKIGWDDERFYEPLPSIVDSYQSVIYTGENTRGFKPIKPKQRPEMKNFSIEHLPGHHGTGSGNMFHQDKTEIKLPDGTVGNASHVQDLLFCQLIDFYNKNGSKIASDKIKERSVDEWQEYFAKLGKQPIEMDSLESLAKKFSTDSHKAQILLDIYNKIAKNKATYDKMFSKSYPLLGREQGWWRISPLGVASSTRTIHAGSRDDTVLPEIGEEHLGHYFVNEEHARLVLLCSVKSVLAKIATPGRPDRSSSDDEDGIIPTKKISIDALCKRVIALTTYFVKPTETTSPTTRHSKEDAATAHSKARTALLEFFAMYANYTIAFMSHDTPWMDSDKRQIINTIKSLADILKPDHAVSPIVEEQEEQFVLVNIAEVQPTNSKELLKTGFLGVIQEKTALAFNNSLDNYEKQLVSWSDAFNTNNPSVRLEAANQIMSLKARMIDTKTRYIEISAIKISADEPLFTEAKSIEINLKIQKLEEQLLKLEEPCKVLIRAALEVTETQDRNIIAEEYNQSFLQMATKFKQEALNRLLQENAQLKRAKIINTRAIMIGCTVGLLVTAAVGGVILTIMFAPAMVPVIIASTIATFLGLSLTGITVGVAVKSVLLTLGLGALAGIVARQVSEPIVNLATSTPTPGMTAAAAAPAPAA